MSSQPDPLSNLWTAARVVATLSLAFVSVVMVFVLMNSYPDLRIDIHLSELIWLFGIVGALVGWRAPGSAWVSGPRSPWRCGSSSCWR